MTNILVVYTSTLGNTHKMAEAVTDGARSVETTTVILREATAATKEEVRVCDALLLGTPIRHRSADARVKQFIENTIEMLWLTDEMLQCAYHHGANVARVVVALQGKDLMVRGNQAPSPELIALFSGS